MENLILNEPNDKKIDMNMLMTIQADLTNGIKTKSNHILITGKCNSRCSFCFSRKRLPKIHFPLNIVNNLMQKGFDLGCQNLIISGGEPTIHPDFISILLNANKIGYTKIKIITNGRMLAYKKFVKKAVEAGLNAIAISVHSHLREIQDELSKSPKNFNQTIRGIKNCIAYGLCVKINIVVNAKNLKSLDKTIEYFHSLGIEEISLLRLMPFGRAWINKQSLFYNQEKNKKYLLRALNLAQNRKINLSVNRFDLDLFRDFPQFMQHPLKFMNEVNSKLKEFNNLIHKNMKFYCYPERCNYCFLNDFCQELNQIQDFIILAKKDKTKIIPVEYENILDENSKVDLSKFTKKFIGRYLK